MDIQKSFTAKNIIFSLLILLIVYLIIKMPDIALLLFGSYVISSAINPLIEKLSNKMPRAFATTTVILATIIVILCLFTPIVVMAFNEIKEFLAHLPQQLDKIQNFVSTFKIAGINISQYLNIDTIMSNSTTIASELIDKSINLTVGFFGLLTVLVTLGIIVFFLSNDKTKIKSFTLKLFPSQMRDRASVVMDELETKVGGYIAAQVLCITIVGLIVATILAILKVQYAVLLGFISAILDLVPIVGPVLTGVLILLVAAPKGWLIAILAISSLFIAQFVENNWAKPYFFSKYMDLHPLVVIFSFVIAAKFLGVVGVLIAPAIAAVLVTLFEEIYVKTMNDKHQEILPNEDLYTQQTTKESEWK